MSNPGPAAAAHVLVDYFQKQEQGGKQSLHGNFCHPPSSPRHNGGRHGGWDNRLKRRGAGRGRGGPLHSSHDQSSFSRDAKRGCYDNQRSDYR